MSWPSVLLVTVALVACKDGQRATSTPVPGSTGSASAATPKPPAPAATGSTDAAAQVVPFLYRVRSGDATSHVLGTVDIGVAVTRLPPSVWDAFAKAKRVVLEWNFGERTAGLREQMQRPADAPPLSATLTPDERTALAGAMGGGAADLERVATWMATAVVSSTGIPRTDAIQAVLADRAQTQEQPITYLETMESQNQRLAKWLDARALSALLADVGALRRGNDAYLAAFTRGDEAELARLRGERTPWKTAGRSGADLTALEQATLGDRHATWLPILRPLLEAGGAFLAIDASHLVGPGNLLDRLREAGFEVVKEGA